MLALLLFATTVGAQTAADSSAGMPLQEVAFLFGEWAARGDTELGAAEGVCSFTPEIGNRIVVRRSWVKYSSGRAAGTRHEDLLIIYAEDMDSRLRAVFFDGEGHVIHYNVTVPSPNEAVFESEPSQPGPKYRLTHTVTDKTLETRFEVAPPGQSKYQTYVSGSATRK